MLYITLSSPVTRPRNTEIKVRNMTNFGLAMIFNLFVGPEGAQPRAQRAGLGGVRASSPGLLWREVALSGVVIVTLLINLLFEGGGTPGLTFNVYSHDSSYGLQALRLGLSCEACAF